MHDDRYIESKIIACGDKVYTNFSGINVPEDDIKCECFTVISIDYLLVYENKYYLQDNKTIMPIKLQQTNYKISWLKCF